MNVRHNPMKAAYILVALLATITMIGALGCRFAPKCRDSAQTVVPVQQPAYKTPANLLVSQYFHQLKPRRIVIATPVSRTHLLPEQTAFANALAESFRYVGFAEAVVCPSCACDTQAIRKGKFDLQQLVDLSNDYSADAVLYCDVVSFSSYDPLQASVSMTLVDASEAIAIMAIDGNWDLRDVETQNAYLRYLSRTSSDSEFQKGIKFQSPSEFLNFVSLDIARFMNDQ